MKLETIFLKKIKIILEDEYFKDNFIRIAFLLSFLLNLALWFYISSQLRESHYSITLHYTIYFGIDLLGEAWQSLTIALVGFVIFVVNIILGFYIYKYKKIGSYFLAVTSILVQVFLFLAAYGLVLINK